MRNSGLIFLFLLLATNLIGQEEINHKVATFEVKHFESFGIMKSEPKVKEWDFKLTIKQIGENEFTACYSKELVDCLFQMKALREEGVRLNSKGVCFTYILTEDNQVQVTDSDQVNQYLNELMQFESSKYKKKELKEILEDVDFYLEYEDELDKDLTRELSLIHEYDYMDIGIGVLGNIDENDEEVFFENVAEIENFLNTVNWKPINRIDVYRTPEINDEEFLYDYMFGINLATSKQKADFEQISKTYFEGDLKVDDYDNVTLNRDQRRLSKEDTRLSYLLKERRTVSSTLRKVTKLEIVKK